MRILDAGCGETARHFIKPDQEAVVQSQRSMTAWGDSESEDVE